MKHGRTLSRGSVWLAAIAALAHCAPAIATEKNPPDTTELAFFESKIRPVLVKHCYQCHSTKGEKVQGGLVVDSRQGLHAGGDSGPAITPGDADASLLIDAIRYGGDSYQMPPQGKLPEAVIADFERWVNRGAIDPREGTTPTPSASKIDLEAGREFWAFRPLADPTPPEDVPAAWRSSAIDRFIAAGHVAAGIGPVAMANRRTLLRRLTFDLTGLPPTVEEIDAFLADRSPAAVETVVDRLLESPQFGERWGRHWLDLARYADSNGSDINLTFPYAWRYRDYVIAAFNEDRPYDAFIREQIAGDLLPADSIAQQQRQWIATGFLLVGPKMLSERDKEKLRLDVADEQVDTIGRAFMGLTLGCARCHDHKFDPIPTADYYALAGIFYNTETVSGIRMGNVNVSGWLERELPMATDQAVAVQAYRKQTETLQQQIKNVQAKLKGVSPRGARSVESLKGIVVDDPQAKQTGDWIASTYSPDFVGRGYVHDDKTGKGEKSITFTPRLPKAGLYDIRIAYTPGQGRHARVPIDIETAEGRKTVYLNQERPPSIDNLLESVGQFRLAAGRAASVTIRTEGTDDAHVVADAVQFLPVDHQPQPVDKAAERSDQHRKTKLQAELKELEAELKALRARPIRAAKAMAVRDRAEIEPCALRVRGEPHNRGPHIPRGFLQIVAQENPPEISPEQSGRLQLAQWLTHPDHPLVARVYVNRLWHHLFGAGLVRTTDNFGQQGERPSHPELLDYLAREFIQDGWSTKRAIRRVVLSRTYQLASVSAPAGMATDAENRLLWRQNRRRHSAEALRDALLTFSGQLDLTMGGTAVGSLGEQAISNSASQSGGVASANHVRRSIYLPLVRNDLPDFLDVFDLANPDVVTGRRAVTNVPSQALLLLNSPTVVKHARHAAQRLLSDAETADARVVLAYRRAFGRPPSDQEQLAAQAFLTKASRDDNETQRLESWSQFCQVLIASTEFRFLD